jgi:hypothetical protein
MEIIVLLDCLGHNDKEKVCTCSVQMQNFLNIFDPWLVVQMWGLQIKRANCFTSAGLKGGGGRSNIDHPVKVRF